MNEESPGKHCPTQNLLGWSFAAINERECVELILRELQAGRGGWLVTANVDHLRRLQRDAPFSSLCRRASLLVADGMPLIWISRLQGTPLPERVAGSSLISTLSAAASTHGRSIFLLGGEPGTAEAAASVLQSRHPELAISGICCPMLGGDPDADKAEKRRIADMLAVKKPDIVYVALGSPKQEMLIDDLRCHLPSAWWLGVGISFSYLCGRIKRPPAWVRRAGLEWLFRLAQEPRRLSSRYLRDDLPFGMAVLFRIATIRLSRAWASFGRG